MGITYALNLGSGTNGPKRVVRKTNWKGFKADIDQKSNELKNALDAAEPIAGVEFNQRYLGINDVENGAISLNSDMNECMDINSKMTSGRLQVKGFVFFNKKLRKLKERVEEVG